MHELYRKELFPLCLYWNCASVGTLAGTSPRQVCIGLVDVMYPSSGSYVEFHEFDPPMHKFHWVSLNKTLASPVGFVPGLELCLG